MPVKHTRPSRRRQEKLLFTTLRNFDGGLNLIDNELNMSPKYSTDMTNVMRSEDGAITVRYGTEFFTDTKSVQSGNLLGTDPLTTVIGSNIVKVTQTSHPFIPGHDVTLTNVPAVNGIPAVELNKTHIISNVVDANTYEITVVTNATSSGAGGGAIILWSSYYKRLNISGSNKYAVNATYFSNFIVVIDADGNIGIIDVDGNSYRIFDADIASILPLSGAGWSTIQACDFTPYNNKLVLVNGLDKPIVFDPNYTVYPVTYLQDLGTLTNTNVPVCSYVTSLNGYLCMAGDPTYPDRVHIGAKGVLGTFVGDPPPNDAIYIDLGKYTETNDQIIRGLATYRNHLVVLFQETSVIIELGNYDAGGNHVPNIVDEVSNIGTIANNSVKDLGNDLLSLDFLGVNSFKRTLISTENSPTRFSELIDPDLQTKLQAISDDIFSYNSQRIFALWNKKHSQYMLFIPNTTNPATTTETICYVYNYSQKTQTKLNIAAWYVFRDWNFNTGCVSLLGDVYLFNGENIYKMGNKDNPIYGDFIGDGAVGRPVAGEDINFSWELPWGDFDARLINKIIKFIQLDSEGTGTFTIQCFVDNIKYDKDGNLDPDIEYTFVGGDSLGYGGTPSGSGFGGGRNTKDERLFEFPTRGKIFKFRFSGSVTEYLKIISMTLAYAKGSIRK